MNVDAEVKLISTDDKTVSVRLDVFRELLPSGHAPLEIRFTDPSIEDGFILHLFYAYINGYLIPGVNTVPLQVLDPLLGFLRKYECQAMIRTLLLDLRSYLPRRLGEPVAKLEATPIEVFTLAATFASVPICADILAACPTGEEQQWESLDTRVMPAEIFERLPSRFAWGLMRSMEKSQPMTNAASWRKAARVFRELMSENGAANAGKFEDTAAARVKARSDRKAKLSSCPYPR